MDHMTANGEDRSQVLSWTSTAVQRKYRTVPVGVLALGAATMLFAASGLR